MNILRKTLRRLRRKSRILMQCLHNTDLGNRLTDTCSLGRSRPSADRADIQRLAGQSLSQICATLRRQYSRWRATSLRCPRKQGRRNSPAHNNQARRMAPSLSLSSGRIRAYLGRDCLRDQPPIDLLCKLLHRKGLLTRILYPLTLHRSVLDTCPAQW